MSDKRRLLRDTPLRIGISTRALFNLEEEHAVFVKQGVQAYATLQLERENIHTLRAWGTPADEAHFVGARSKAPILKAFGAHIFFDDQEKHVVGASSVVPAGLVPGPHSPDEPVIPAG
jgi:5'-nucleotidase